MFSNSPNYSRSVRLHTCITQVSGTQVEPNFSHPYEGPPYKKEGQPS